MIWGNFLSAFLTIIKAWSVCQTGMKLIIIAIAATEAATAPAAVPPTAIAAYAIKNSIAPAAIASAETAIPGMNIADT